MNTLHPKPLCLKNRTAKLVMVQVELLKLYKNGCDSTHIMKIRGLLSTQQGLSPDLDALKVYRVKMYYNTV